MIKNPNKIKEMSIKFGCIPPKGYLAITMFGTIYINKKNKEYWDRYSAYYKEETMIHEGIHLKQAQNDGSWFKFYCKYLWWWIKAMFLSGFKNSIAYYCIPYEVEAFMYENNKFYNCERSKAIQNIPTSALVDLKKNSSSHRDYILAVKNLY